MNTILLRFVSSKFIGAMMRTMHRNLFLPLLTLIVVLRNAVACSSLFSSLQNTPTTAGIALGQFSVLPGRQVPQISLSRRFKQDVISNCLHLRGGAAPKAIIKFGNYIEESKTRCWILLVLSILIETAATTMIKLAREESSWVKLCSGFLTYFMSLLGFAICLEQIDLSVAYAVWAALGTAIVALAGIILFGESCDSLKLISLLMIVLGVVGLNLRDSH